MNWRARPSAALVTLLVVHLLAHIRNILLGFAPQITRDLSQRYAQYGLPVGAVWCRVMA